VVVVPRENREGSAQEESVFTRESITNEEEQEQVVVVFTRENRGGSAQHATRATPTRSSHRPIRA